MSKTSNEITDEQIEALCEEAMAASDYQQVDICCRALCADDEVENQDGDRIAFSDWTQAEARAECARVIAYPGAASS